MTVRITTPSGDSSSRHVGDILVSLAAQVAGADMHARRANLLRLLAEALYAVAGLRGSAPLDPAPRPRVTKAKADAIIDILVTMIQDLRESTGPVTGLAHLLQHVQAGAGGSRFTPVPVARLIVRLAIHRWLVATTGVGSEDVARLIFGPEPPSFTRPEIRALLAAVQRVRIYDPAAGGGVFLLAAMETLAALRSRLGDRSPFHEIRQSIVEHNLFGVEIEPALAAVASGALILASCWTPLPRRRRRPITHPPPWPVMPRNSLLHGGRPGRFHPGLQADILVGNPPYQRQESQGVSKALGQALFRQLTGAAIGGRADASVPFFALMHHLSRGGVGALLTPNAWLDAEYGRPLQRYLRGLGDIAVLESGIERWFPAAVKVNTAVTFVSRAIHLDTRSPTRFVDLQRGVLDLRPADLIDLATSVTPDLRPAGDGALTIRHRAIGRITDLPRRVAESKLGQYLRTPSVWLRTLDERQGEMVRLDEIATVSNGHKTGMNKVFVVEDVTDAASTAKLIALFEMTHAGLKAKGFRAVAPSGMKEGLHRHETWHRLPERSLSPFLLNSEELTTPRILGSKLRWRVVHAHRKKQDERLDRYLEWAKQALLAPAERERISRRSRWRAPTIAHPSNVPVIVAPNNSFGRAVVGIVSVEDPAVVSNSFFTIAPVRSEWVRPVAAYLMSSPGLLERERVGRTALGDGGLKTDGMDLAQMRLPDPRRLSARLAKRLNQLVEDAMDREFRPILDELGTDPWRAELDQFVLEWMGIDPKTCDRYQRALKRALERRLARVARFIAGQPS